MKKIFKISVFVFAIALVLASCKPVREQVEIKGCELESLEGVSLGLGQVSFNTLLKLDASNASGRDISLARLYATIFTKSGKEVATVTYSGQKGDPLPTLSRRSEQAVDIPLEVVFDNPLSAITLAAMSLDDYAAKGYTVSYDCTLKSGCIKKRFKGEKVPVETIVKMLDK